MAVHTCHWSRLYLQVSRLCTFLKGFIIVRGNRVLFYWNTCTSRGYLLSTFFFYDDKSNTFSASKFPKSIEFILKFTGAFNKNFILKINAFWGSTVRKKCSICLSMSTELKHVRNRIKHKFIWTSLSWDYALLFHADIDKKL